MITLFLSFLALLLLSPRSLYCADPPLDQRPPFFVSSMLQYYGGQNLELLNTDQSYDSYSFMQYIGDFGIHFPQRLQSDEAISKDGTLPISAPRFLTLDAVFRIKGNLGNAGLYNQTSSIPIKIGWTATETAHNHSIDKFLWWVREAAVTYGPEPEKNRFFKVGLFPYKLGNGLILGNAYKITIPIPGQFVYPQIDQFRPGLQGTITTSNKQFSATAYLGILDTTSDSLSQTARTTQMQNLEASFPQQGPGKGNIVVAGEFSYMPALNNKTIVLNPYFLFQKDNTQTVEFPSDATSTLSTPGIFASFEKGGVRISCEIAKNFGHQRVKAWDRNQLIFSNELFNTHLFYVSDLTLTLDTVAINDFSPSPYIIQPPLIAQLEGNGTDFLYAPTPGNTFIFKNSYDRLRKGYTNSYKGFLVYTDLLFSCDCCTLGIAGGCASGDNYPNDSPDMITMTRLTPGITYSDFDKNYKGLVSVNQMYEGKAIQPLYFGQAQKLNRPLSLTDNLTTPLFTNQCFLGATVQGNTSVKNGLFSSSGTVVTYFQDHQITKGVSATLWQAQSIDFTPQMQADMTTPLPRFLGTELNGSLTYSIGTDLSFSIIAAVFIPGSYYKQAAGTYIPLIEQEELEQFSFTPDQGAFTPTLGNSSCFFVGINLTCLFDFTRIGSLKNRYKKDCDD